MRQDPRKTIQGGFPGTLFPFPSLRGQDSTSDGRAPPHPSVPAPVHLDVASGTHPVAALYGSAFGRAWSLVPSLFVSYRSAACITPFSADA